MQAFSILIAALLTVAFVARADSANLVTENREVGNFTGVAFSLPGELILIQGDEVALSVTATAELLEEIVTEVEDGVLEIRHDAGWWSFDRNVDDVVVEVTFVTLDRLAVSGSGSAAAKTLESEDLEVSISGSATVRITTLSTQSVSVAISGSGKMSIAELDATSLASSISGSGTVDVGGHADTQSISISGSGDHSATKLESKEVEAVVAGSGTAEVWATETLDAVIAGSGDVIYRGEPQVSERIAGSGSVRHRRLEI